MPLPYPKWKKQGKNLSPHEQALNSMVILLSWLHLGQASKVPSSFSAAAPLTGEQRGVVARLRRLSSAWVGASAVDAEAMGRTAAKIEAMESTVHELTRRAVLLQDFQGSGGLVSAGNVAQRFQGELGVVASGEVTSEVQAAKEIEADRLTFGGRPSFNPMPFLDEVTARVYEDPLACSMPPEECLQEPPKVKIRGKRSEVLKLLHKLDDTGRLALFTPQEVRMRFRAGAFSLIKNQTKDRLILDSRPHNLLEEPLGAYTQTMGAMQPLLDIYLRADETLQACCEDLNDYYYLYSVSSQRSARIAMAWRLTYAEASKFSVWQSRVLHPVVSHNGDGRC